MNPLLTALALALLASPPTPNRDATAGDTTFTITVTDRDQAVRDRAAWAQRRAQAERDAQAEERAKAARKARSDARRAEIRHERAGDQPNATSTDATSTDATGKAATKRAATKRAAVKRATASERAAKAELARVRRALNQALQAPQPDRVRLWSLYERMVELDPRMAAHARPSIDLALAKGSAPQPPPAGDDPRPRLDPGFAPRLRG
ncbi:MAG: hypothetical protein KDK70_11035 [Myxococcales bacterium]|nr:hypothetical protein [Myxococcales bacterium]